MQPTEQFRELANAASQVAAGMEKIDQLTGGHPLIRQFMENHKPNRLTPEGRQKIVEARKRRAERERRQKHVTRGNVTQMRSRNGKFARKHAA